MAPQLGALIDISLEAAVIGGVLNHPDQLGEVDHLAPDDFHSAQHQAIWNAVLTLGEGRITVETVFGAVPEHRKTVTAALAAGCSRTALPPNVDLLADLAWRRRLFHVGRDLSQVAVDGGDPTHLLDQVGHRPAAVDEYAPGGDWMLDIPDQTPAIWGTGTQILWAAGESLMICGPPGVGKTTICGQVVFGLVGIHDTVLGWPIRQAEKVLYLAMDRPQQIARALGRLAGHAHRDVLNERLAVHQGPPPADIAAQPTLLTAMARRAGADVIVIDSLKDAAVGLSDDETGAAVNRAIQHCLAADINVLILHHQTKRGGGGVGKPKTLADVYGSAWITAGTGSVVLLWGDAGDPIVELLHLKQPAEDVGPLKIAHDQNTGMSEIVDKVDLVVLAGQQPQGLTARAAAVAMFTTDDPSRAQIAKATRRLTGLADVGVLEEGSGYATANGGKPTKTWIPRRTT